MWVLNKNLLRNFKEILNPFVKHTSKSFFQRADHVVKMFVEGSR